MLLLRLPSLSAMRPQVLRDWRAKAQTMSQIEDPRRIVVEARRGRSRAIARDKALREMRFLTSYFFFSFSYGRSLPRPGKMTERGFAALYREGNWARKLSGFSRHYRWMDCSRG